MTKTEYREGCRALKERIKTTVRAPITREEAKEEVREIAYSTTAISMDADNIVNEIFGMTPKH
jgi:hypothetical protein